MKFEAEIKEVRAKKTASLDTEYRIVFVTENSNVLKLGALPPDQTVEVEIKE